MARRDTFDRAREEQVAENAAKRAAKAKPWRSGFCNPSNPDDSHKRCEKHPRADGKPCACECHTDGQGDAVAEQPGGAPTGAQALTSDGGGTERGAGQTPLAAPPLDLADELAMEGFFEDLDEETYHKHPTSLSVSGAKVLLKAPALYMHQRLNPVYEKTFDFGTAAHALVLGVGAELVVHEYDAEKVKSPKATNAWKAQQAEVRKTGGVLLLPEEFATVRAMADKLSEHRLAMRLLAEGQPEVSAFCVDEATGVMRRGRFDWLGPRVVVDYKSAVSVDPRELSGRYGVIKKLAYDMQASWYLDLARDLGHPVEEFAFIFQMKEPPYLVTVAIVPEDELHDARLRNRLALERFRDCTESGHWPGFLPDDTAAVISLGSQEYDLEEIA